MSYHRTALGMPPAFSTTQAFAQAVDPYATRMSPRHSIYSPYGWGPDFNIGMPMNYTHHLDYVTDPAAIAIPRRRPAGVRGPMYDRVAPYLGQDAYEGDMQRLGLAGILAAM
jgi:hypothetical protein